MVGPDPEHPFVKDPLFWKRNALVQELLFTAGPVVCDEWETDPRVNGAWADYLRRRGTKRFFAVPILVSGQVKGLLDPPYRSRVLSAGGDRINSGARAPSHARASTQ